MYCCCSCTIRVLLLLVLETNRLCLQYCLKIFRLSVVNFEISHFSKILEKFLYYPYTVVALFGALRMSGGLRGTRVGAEE